MAKESGEKLIANNKKAYHDYFIEEKYEAGIALVGTEVKSVRISVNGESDLIYRESVSLDQNFLSREDLLLRSSASGDASDEMNDSSGDN